MKKAKIENLPILSYNENLGVFTLRRGNTEIKVRTLPDIIVDTQGTLPCVVTEAPNGHAKARIDKASLIRQYFPVGEVIKFSVKNDFRQSTHNYEIIDRHKVTTYLWNIETLNLYKNQQLSCRVLRVEKLRPIVELIEIGELVKNSSQGGFSVTEEFIKNILGERRWNVERFASDLLTNELDTTFETHIHDSLLNVVNRHKEECREVLEDIREASLMLLEKSDFLNRCNLQERRIFQVRMTLIIERVNYFIDAFNAIDNGEDEQFIDDLLDKIEMSGYVFHPIKNFSKQSCLFLMKPELMEKKIPRIFNIIRSRGKDFWLEEPFRTEFVKQLEMYIIKTDNDLCRQGFSDSMLCNVFQALTIQLLLATPKDDELLDITLNKAKLYRYASMMKVMNPMQMLERAYSTIIGDSQQSVNYSIESTQNPDALANIIANEPDNEEEEGSDAMSVFKTDGMDMKLTPSNISIRKTGRNYMERPILPKGLNAWLNINVGVEDLSKVMPKQVKLDSINPYKQIWDKINAELFSKHVIETKKEVVTPPVGATVKVYVTRLDNKDRNLVHCKIVDEKYEGRAMLPITYNSKMKMPVGIVPYKVFPDITDFWSDNGHPLLFDADVVEKVGDDCIIDIHNQINDLVYSEDFAAEEEMVCSIGEYSKVKNRYSAINDCGISVSIDGSDITGKLKPNDIVIVRDIMHGFEGYQLWASFDRMEASQQFSLTRAFHNLMSSYANDEEFLGNAFADYDDSEEVEGVTILEPSYMQEFMRILDCISLLDHSHNYALAYNYLALGKMISRFIEDEQQELYFKNRMELMEILSNLATTKTVDEERLARLVEENPTILTTHSVVSRRFMQLKIVSCMSKPENNDQLYDIVRDSEHESLKELARLVLTYNFLVGSEMEAEADKVSRAIMKQLDLKEHSSGSIGEESTTVEFKTSVVYPPNNHMKPNIDVQTRNIMLVVATFLNTNGGDLYIGVDDAGIPTGLFSDLKFFGNNTDKYKQHIGQSIRDCFGAHVLATCINTEFKAINGEQVYVVHISPYYKGFKFDNKYFIRGEYGRIPLTENEFLEYNENRKLKLSLSTFSGVDIDEEERPEEATSASLISKEKEEEKAAAAPLEYSTDYNAIKTSKIRLTKMKNDGISEDELTRFISLQEDNTYMLSPMPAGGSLSLGIRDEEQDGVLVVVTENGEVRRIDIANLLEGNDWEPVAINDKSKIVFMSPTTLDYHLIIVYRHKNTVYLRMETVESLKDSTFNKSGRKFFTGQIDEVILCELIDNDTAIKLKTIQGFSSDRLGVDYAKTEGKKTRRLIEELGADVSGI